jgi:hypothetical protein
VRLLVPTLVAGVLVLFGACYERPKVPPDKPLSCTGTDASGDCPTGFTCIGQICAPRSCVADTDCPAGLVCRPQRGCGLPGDDGGVEDGGVIPILADGGGGVVPPPLDGSVPPVDAPPTPAIDAPTTGTTPPGTPDGGIR